MLSTHSLMPQAPCLCTSNRQRLAAFFRTSIQAAHSHTPSKSWRNTLPFPSYPSIKIAIGLAVLVREGARTNGMRKEEERPHRGSVGTDGGRAFLSIRCDS